MIPCYKELCRRDLCTTEGQHRRTLGTREQSAHAESCQSLGSRHATPMPAASTAKRDPVFLPHTPITARCSSGPVDFRRRSLFPELRSGVSRWRLQSPMPCSTQGRRRQLRPYPVCGKIQGRPALSLRPRCRYKAAGLPRWLGGPPRRLYNRAGSSMATSFSGARAPRSARLSIAR
jgi:hypothetical protein